MGKRQNRKRTRSRPRHRSNHTRTLSADTNASFSSPTTSFPQSHISQHAIATAPASYCYQPYPAWQDRRLQYEQEREKVLEAQRMRFFGGEAGDDISLLEPMLKVVTDLFDGMTDFDYP